MNNEIFGFDNYIEQLRQVKRELPHELERWLVEQALDLEARTKFKTPVDTGDLRRNWNVSEIERNGDSISITVSNPLHYAVHQEYGFRVRGDSGNVVRGAYMLTTSLKELERNMPQQVRKLWERCGF